LCALRIESPQAVLDLGEDPAAGPDGEQAQLLGLERLEALETEELRLLAVGPCGRVLPEVEDRLRRLNAERAQA